MSAAWYCCRRCRWYQWQFTTSVNNTMGTGGKICRRCRWYRWQICRRCRWYRQQICHRCRWHRWCTLTCKYLREFSKKIKMILMLFSGAWGKVIHEKNLKQKILWHCPWAFQGCAQINVLHINRTFSKNMFYISHNLFIENRKGYWKTHLVICSNLSVIFLSKCLRRKNKFLVDV